MGVEFEAGLRTLCHSKAARLLAINCCLETQSCHERRLFAIAYVRYRASAGIGRGVVVGAEGRAGDLGDENSPFFRVTSLKSTMHQSRP
jgi:hypothetical protein